jgi:hypothetical protein
MQRDNTATPTKEGLMDKAIDVSYEADMIERTLMAALRACKNVEEGTGVAADVHVLLSHAHHMVVDVKEQARDYGGLCQINDPETLTVKTI